MTLDLHHRRQSQTYTARLSMLGTPGVNGSRLRTNRQRFRESQIRVLQLQIPSRFAALKDSSGPGIFSAITQMSLAGGRNRQSKEKTQFTTRKATQRISTGATYFYGSTHRIKQFMSEPPLGIDESSFELDTPASHRRASVALREPLRTQTLARNSSYSCESDSC